MLLYIHVPFCRSKCGYCAFHSEVPKGDALQQYVDNLLQEIAIWGDRLGPVELSTIFFGGGTPSLLPFRILPVIMDRIQKAFRIAPNAEISFEANPDSVASMDYMQALLDSGVNRLSMGVQSLNDTALRLLGRRHTAKDAIRTYELARTMGFSNINMDFIWGLPDQRLKLWLAELKNIVNLSPDHLSCYGLTVEPDTPMENACLKNTIALPEEQEQAKMFIYGADYLEAQGYLHYEISNFSRMGYQCRHNIGYWEGEEYLGLGPSAVSTVQGKRWTNPYTLSEYIKKINEGSVANDAIVLTSLERVQELVMLRLRTTRGLRVKAYRELTGRDFMKDHKPLIHALHKNQLIRIRNGYLSLTRNGMLVSNTILENFFSAMDSMQEAAVHPIHDSSSSYAGE